MILAVQQCIQQCTQQCSSAPKRLLENLQHRCRHDPAALSSTGKGSREHGTAGGSPQRCSKVAPPPAW